MLKILLFGFIIITTPSCETLSSFVGFEDEEMKESTKSDTKESLAYAPPSQEESRDLQYAKIWARIDELQEKVNAQEEKIRLMEKGFALGLTPTSTPLKTEGLSSPPDANEIETLPNHFNSNASDSKPEEPKTVGTVDSAEYERQMVEVHQLYKLGNYGKAIVALSKMREVYGEKFNNGLHVYWLGKCWIGLRDYDAAKKHLDEFIGHNSESSYIPRAKFDLAKVYYETGYRESAIKLLREIIKQYPYQEVSEMAKLQLENIRQNL